jgi:hypothetical protein
MTETGMKMFSSSHFFQFASLFSLPVAGVAQRYRQ